MPHAQLATEQEASDGALDLQHFFPYRLAVLAEEVSRTVAQLYSDRFDLTRHEWRVLAALGINRQMAAKDIADYSTLDKMSVSRAVAALEAKAYLAREEDPADRRNKILRLTPGRPRTLSKDRAAGTRPRAPHPRCPDRGRTRSARRHYEEADGAGARSTRARLNPAVAGRVRDGIICTPHATRQKGPENDLRSINGLAI